MSQNPPQPPKNVNKGNTGGQNQPQQNKPSGQFSAQDLNRIVLEYLNKKGYHRTEAMLRAESGRTLTPQNKQSSNMINRGSKLPEPSTQPTVASGMIRPVSNPVMTTKRNAEGNAVSKELQILSLPQNYIRAFTMLKNWIDSSLELYKSELNYILYPIFIYMFLELVKKDVIMARRFFDKYSPDFKILHNSEINRLFSVNSVDHIKENEIASAFQNNRYKITISKTVFSLLLYFLTENESIGGITIIDIINDKLDPNTVPRVSSKSKLTDGIKLLTDSKNGSSLESDLNSIPVALGPFPQDEDFVKEVEAELKIKDEKEKEQQQQLADDSTGITNENNTSKENLNKNADELEKPTLLQEYKALNNDVTSEVAESTSNKKDKDLKPDKEKESTEDTVLKDENSLSMTPTAVNTHEKKADEAVSTKKIRKQLETDTKDEKIKLESPSRDILPLPPKTSLDIKLEIQKVKESRDAIKLDNLQVSLPTVCMYTFHNTNGGMTSLEFSDDSRLVAAGFQDSFIKIWSLDGSSLVNPRIPSFKRQEMESTDPSTSTLIGHSGTVYSTSFSPDNRFLLSGSEDKTVRLWSLDTHTALVSYKGHNHPVWDVKFSPLGHYFATASHDQTARLWSSDHIYPLRIFAGHLSDVDTVTFHPNGCYIFTGSSDKTCRMWDINTGNSVRLFLGHNAPILATAVTPDGRWLCTGSDDGLIHVWDIGTGKRIKQMRGHGKNAIHSFAFNKEGNVLISSGADHSVRIWDLKKATSEPGLEPEEPLNGYIGDVTTSLNQDIKEYGRRRTIIPTNDLIASFYTKRTPVFKVKFTRNNIALAGGAFRDI